MSLRIEFHPDVLQPVIELAVETAVRRLQAERPTDADDRVLLCKQQAADALGVSPSTVDRLRQDAGLPCVKLDGRVLFRPEALRAWAAAREGDSTDVADDCAEQ